MEHAALLEVRTAIVSQTFNMSKLLKVQLAWPDRRHGHKVSSYFGDLPSGDGGMELSNDQRLMIESQVIAQRKSIGVAYLLWFFLGLLSVHRFYLDRPGTAILQIVLNCLIVGWVWVLVDAFLIPGMIREHDERVRGRLMTAAGGGPLVPAPDMSQWSQRDKDRYLARRASA
jgi:TM2 domain-containing membrane protein YozV